MIKLFRNLTKLTERGDTVVEVLISIAVVSLILGGAFVTSNRSLQGTRDAEERSNALKMAETQVEQIKYLAASNPNVLFNNGMSSFCLVSGAAVVAGSAPCTVDSTGAQSSVQPTYSLSIQRDVDDFTITSSWIKVGSDQTNKVELKYRAHR